MKLSIVIICLNEEYHLPRCLEAIQRCDKANIDVEIIVVDGGSTDRTREIAASRGVCVLSSQKGIPLQRNHGASAACGEILAFIDADVEILPGWFQTVAKHFCDRCDMILGCYPKLPRDASWIARTFQLHLLRDSANNLGRERETRRLSSGSLVMGHEVFTRIGGFREDLGVDEDTVFILKASELKIRLVHDSELACIHHGEPSTLWEFFRRSMWGANYDVWFQSLRDLNGLNAWRPQYIYGAVCAMEILIIMVSSMLGVFGDTWWFLMGSLALSCATICVPAIVVSLRHRTFSLLPHLCIMYLVFGSAHAFSLFGFGKNKASRWR